MPNQVGRTTSRGSEHVVVDTISSFRQQENSSRLLRACSKCSGCQRVNCQVCVYCRKKVHKTKTRTCIFRLCENFSYTPKTKLRLALAAQRSFQALSMSNLGVRMSATASSTNTSATNNNSENDNNNDDTEAQRFLKQCQTILVEKHDIPLNYSKWQDDSSSWRVWLHRKQQWGTARRVSSDPPRYDIQLLGSSSNSADEDMDSSFSSMMPPPPPRRSVKKRRRDKEAKLTNVPPYEFDLECHFLYLDQKKKPSSVPRPIAPRVGQSFVHSWRRASGDIVQVTGTWTGEYREETEQYQIKVENSTVQPNQHRVTGQDEQQVQAAPIAWGYFRASLTTTRPSKTPFFIQYKTPNMYTSMLENKLPRASFIWENQFQVELQVHPSRQAANAGNGLFACAIPLQSCNNATTASAISMELPPGVLIDLGVYGPLRPQDLKTWSVRMIKIFIYKYHCGSWFFETNTEDDYSVFDMTDDTTGELHALSQQNILVYANETSGAVQDIPSLSPQYDPEGAVHFYLGHPDHDQGPFVLPVEIPVELLVDYGPSYEPERVRKKYPRVSGNHLQHLQDCLDEEDYHILSELEDLSLEEIGSDAIPFLKSLVKSWEVVIRNNPQTRHPEGLERALMVALILLHELRRAPSPSETNLSEVRSIISTLCSLFASDQQMKTWIMSNVVYSKRIRRIVGNYDWDSVPAVLFRRAIDAL